MKWIGALFGVSTAFLIGIYVLLFTPTGHGFLLPMAVEKIEAGSKVKKAEFKSFELSMNQIDMVLDLDGELVKVKGKYDLFSRTLDLNYDVQIKNLATFSKAMGTTVRGDFVTWGKAWGKFDSVFVKGGAKTANGTIAYSLNLEDNDIKNLDFDLKNLSLQKLLWMIGQPLYSDAKLFSKGKIISMNQFNGDVITIVKDGVLNYPVVKKEFEIELPKNPIYDLHIKTKLQNKKASSIVDLNSFAANVDTSKTVFNLETGVLTSDYTLMVPSLAKLYFLTNQKMRGDLRVTGDIKQDKKLFATFNLKEFDGEVNGKLDADQLSVDAKGIQISELLHMMYYPEIFKSPVDVDLDYNLVSKKGTSKIKSSNGQFLTNKAMSMLKKFTKYDMTLEVYNKVNLDTKINDTFLVNNLLMQSKNSQIQSNKLNLDTKNNTIDADIDLEYRGLKAGIGLSGNTTSPNVKLDTSDLLKVKAKEELKKKINKHLGDRLKKQLDEKLDKELGDKLDKQVGDLFKKLF